MFAMARHLGEHPTAIGNLVGIAIAAVTIAGLDEMLEQPGCPNLYWALTNLPKPLIRIDKGMEGERVSVLWVFRDLDEIAPMSEEHIKRVAANYKLLADAADSNPDKTLQAWLEARTKNAGEVSAARRRLVVNGLPEQRLLSFPASQVILLDQKRECEARYDDAVKYTNFPLWQAEALRGPDKPKQESAFFANALLPVLHVIHRAQGRIDQRIALLRHVEALRIFAGEHKRTLPAKLSEMSVPLPDDPFTGKPFRYEVLGTTAHFRGSPPPGEEKNVGFNVHYEVTVKK